MPIEFKIYIAAWLSFCMFCGWLVYSDKQSFSILSSAYLASMSVKWKLITFGIAAIGISVVAPYTGDPTWDYFDAMMMSVLTFVTAPWAVGTLYRAIKGKFDVKQILVAVCVWMLSASWCYDGYLVLRDGAYPGTWFANIFASSVLYMMAGMFWSLEHREGRGVIFSFMEDHWPVDPAPMRFSKVVWYAVPFMAIASASIGYFLL